MSSSSKNAEKKPEKAVKIQATIESIINTAFEIRKEAMDPKYYGVDGEKALSKIQAKFVDFNKTFPIILRHIVTKQYVHKDVLTRFVKLCQVKPTHSIAEFQERQAEYLVMVYRKEHPRCGQKEIARVRNKYVTELKNEEEHMKKIMEEVKKDREKKKSEFDEVKRQEIFQFITKYKNEIPDDVQTELNVDKKPEELDQNEDDDESGNLVLLPKAKNNNQQ